jgi:hypothetical protein
MKRSIDDMTMGEVAGLMGLQDRIDKIMVTVRKRSKLFAKLVRMDEKIKRLLTGKGKKNGPGRPPKSTDKKGKADRKNRKTHSTKPRSPKAQAEPKVMPS